MLVDSSYINFIKEKPIGLVSFSLKTTISEYPFIIFLFLAYHGLPKEDGTAAQQYAKMLGIEKAQVVRIKGFTTEHYEIDNSTENDPVVLE